MDIIWSSFAIIFLCTWSILHLTVPPQVLPPAPESTWRDLYHSFLRSLYYFLRKARWMAITMLTPELVLGCALSNFISARRSVKMIQEFQRNCESRDESEADWTMTHSMYADIGGFTIRFPRQPDWTPEDEEKRDQRLDKFVNDNHRGHPCLGAYDWRVHPQHYALAKELLDTSALDEFNYYKSPSLCALIGDVWVLSAWQILKAREIGIIDKFPSISENDIRDKSKEDGLVKSLALIQAAWLAIQLIIRALTGRQSSQIEIMALAFGVCALISYLLLFFQPKDVSTSTILAASRSPTAAELKRIVDLAPVTGPWPRLHYSMPNFASSLQDTGEIYYLGTIGGLLIFGSIHLIAWNFQFPTTTEQLLWKVSALLVALLPIAWLLLTGFTLSVVIAYWDRTATGARVERITFPIFIALFIIPRFYLLFEAIRSVYYLPPSSYTATWASNIPRLG